MKRTSPQTIDHETLTAVVGGRISPRQNLDPVLAQGMQQLSQAVASIGQNMAAAKQQSMQQLTQMAQARGGGGKH
jgi:hypothetical protein